MERPLTSTTPRVRTASARGQPKTGGWPSLQLLSLPLLLFFVLPLIALFLRATPAELLDNLRSPQALQAIGISVISSLVATILAILFGTPVAYALANERLPFSRVTDTLIDLPTVLPPAVAGVALLLTFGRRGLLGGTLQLLGIEVAFTTLAVILAQLFVAAPYYVKAAAAGFRQVNPELVQAAGLDGAGGIQVFRYVITPLSWQALVSGAVMTWARGLGEFGATIIFAGNFPGRTQTMPLAIYLGFEMELQLALTLAVILIAFSFLALLIVKGLLYRNLNSEID